MRRRLWLSLTFALAISGYANAATPGNEADLAAALERIRQLRAELANVPSLPKDEFETTEEYRARLDAETARIPRETAEIEGQRFVVSLQMTLGVYEADAREFPATLSHATYLQPPVELRLQMPRELARGAKNALRSAQGMCQIADGDLILVSVWVDWQRARYTFREREPLWREIRIFSSHHAPVNTVSLSTDGRFLATGSDDMTAKLWDVSSSRELRTLKGFSGGIVSICFSTDDRLVAAASWDKTARIWEAESGKEISTLRGHSGGVLSASFGPDGCLVATASEDQTVRLWDVRTGSKRCVLNGHTNWVRSVCFSPDGRYLATGAADHTARLWDVESASEVRVFRGHTGDVNSVAFSPDSKYLATASSDSTAAIWNVASGRRIRDFRGHENEVWSVAFDPSGSYLATGSWDRTVRLWNVTTGTELKKLTEFTGWVYTVAFSRNGRFLASGSVDRTTRVWRRISLELSQTSIARVASEPELTTITSATTLNAAATFVDSSQDDTLEADESATLRIIVRNDGDGDARNVTATLSTSGVSGVTAPPTVSVGDIPARSERSVDVPIEAELTLQTGELSITATFQEDSGNPPKPVSATIRTRGVNVDENLPLAKRRNPHGVAVVIGVEDYPQDKSAPLPVVPFALRDAQTVRSYLLQAFGFEPSNILVRTDSGATKGEFARVFDQDGWLERRVKTLGTPSAADVFFYFAGHGAPSVTPEGVKPILVPYDGDPNYAAQTCVPLGDVLSRLAALGARSVTVVLDSCFSGSGRANESDAPRLLAEAREAVWDVDPVAKAGIAVFSAASGFQWSSSYPAVRHGLFTYFFLRGVRGEAESDADARITVDELDRYLSRSVPKAAFELYEREQTPTLQATDSVKARALVELAAKP
ncbi:hypothetical protein FJZ36_13995 [Candidatus Poribacteria bacterium]|nr:hypothetical protein [Candidatus Poribacteria bacterium]